MANKAIDIVVPFLNPASASWQAEYAKYANQIGMKAANRFRDWGTMRYWLRGVEQNCPWVNKIHMILFDESMIPDWLNVNHDKLHIVFHRDYIPSKYLPTFSSSVIEMFIPWIPGLAEQFIYSCDDMLFTKSIPENMFFDNGQPVSPLLKVGHSYQNIVEDWNCIENNNIRLIEKLLGGVYNCHHPHFQIAFKKSFMQFIWSELGKDFEAGLSHSKFRNKYENQIWIFDDLQRLLGIAITNRNIFGNAKYNSINNGDFSMFAGKQIVCFNDVDAQKNYEYVLAQFNKYMDSVLPTKSGFEL